MSEIFDHIDVFYLTNSLTIFQLRHEIHQAEMRATIAIAYRGTEYHAEGDLFPWEDYAVACREAIEWQRNSQQKPQMAKGRVDIEAIKIKNDIVAVAKNYTKLRKSGQNLIGNCPLHPDKHPSFVVYPDQQSWHCFQCSRGGDVITLVQLVEHKDFRGATAILGVR